MVFQRTGAEAILACQARISKNSHQGCDCRNFFFFQFCAPASNHLFTCSVSWLDFFFLMRHSLGVFGKRSVEAIYSLPPRTLRLPSNHPGLCCSLPYFLPPGVLSGQFLTAVVFICRVVPGRITSPGKAML